MRTSTTLARCWPLRRRDRKSLDAQVAGLQRAPQLKNTHLLPLVVLVLAACVPMVSHEYDVKGQGEKSESGGCSSTAEVLLTTHLTPATAVVFWGSVERLHPNHRIVSISFTFSNDEMASLTKFDVILTSRSYAAPRVISITTIRRASMFNSPSCGPPTGSVYQQPDEPMHRMIGAQYGRTLTVSIFVIDVSVPDNPCEFTVSLPPVLINAVLVNVPAVTFLRRSSVYFPSQLM